MGALLPVSDGIRREVTGNEGGERRDGMKQKFTATFHLHGQCLRPLQATGTPQNGCLKMSKNNTCCCSRCCTFLCWSSLNQRGVDASQKPQYCIVNTHTYTHKAVTLRSPVNSLQCLLSALCRHRPKRQCCVQLIPLFRRCWRPLARTTHDLRKRVFVCVHVWLCHIHYGPPLCLSHPALIFICINTVCLGSVSPPWVPLTPPPLLV